jgi:hypothetical protein
MTQFDIKFKDGQANGFDMEGISKAKVKEAQGL